MSTVTAPPDTASSPPHTEEWRLRVTGVVQGVGYRPFVYKLAHELGLSGWVRNDPEGVLVEASGPDAALAEFAAGLKDRAPELARVDGVMVTRGLPTGSVPVGPFTITHSEQSGARSALIPSDTHVCGDCQGELRDPKDRRHRYPFINCTNCGPRYSIIQDLPYDRPMTTMASFTMCAACRAEYEDPMDRRYHAQPNACPDCGPRLLLTDREGRTTEGDTALRGAAQALADGAIVAIKSVGGFHLAVDATQPEAVALLRRRKRRDSKPFAVMVRDLATAQRLAVLSEDEIDVLRSPARPILLARKQPDALPESVAPRNPNLGIMLPSAPHHHLLLDEPGLEALVMTSGNVSGYPIAYRNEEALEQLFEIADVILYHDRDIEIRVDDSVVRLSVHEELDEPLLQFIRRARGYAPYPVDVGREVVPAVALGAELKTTVALSHGRHVFLSQHIGDLKNDETFASHRRTARHLARLYALEPRLTAHDLHPQFRSTRAALGEDGAGRAVVEVQHHHAHMASCMAENHVTGTTLGVIFDGFGYGEDGTVWGGEFLLGDYAAFQRIGRLRRLPLIGGDQAVREPIRTGYALALDAFDGDRDRAAAAFPALAVLDDRRRHVYATMAARGINSPATSSMGRLFDGAAALAGVCARAEYEAQGPIELEGLLLRDAALEPAYRFGTRVPDEDADGPVEVDPRPVIRAMAADIAAALPADRISRRFHTAVVEMVRERCRAVRERTGVRQIVLSGGVFLNEFLLLNCLTGLTADGFDTYVHRQVPTNDGGIALGQVMVADARTPAGK
ncbi:carbamoyltransferase HypF [Streptomyces caelestis]|uniref:Carbamoyltransferase n=1 Tax=Streptomyces caelestis TaxID=36816 RepID=A0A7W9H4A3_9ACTN|nr:carbamoyltransferase HypF [Streptomyces caelestis]MBB5795439.1 hydrogenase maturation protein HypF [Streptomyces caelestis]GGW60030.1 carbamoyltransferase HypF [Streptomyces caelestis]